MCTPINRLYVAPKGTNVLQYITKNKLSPRNHDRDLFNHRFNLVCDNILSKLDSKMSKIPAKRVQNSRDILLSIQYPKYEHTFAFRSLTE